MNENSPDLNCPRNSASGQGSCCDRLPAGTSSTANDSTLTASSAAMLQKRSPASLCNNRSLCILEELNRIYEERLNDIDQQTNGNHELKYLTYKEWVEMLLKLMRDLIDVVQELEYEASCRIDLLEKKLQSESSAVCNTTDLGKLRNDVSNLVELIRRALQEGSWNMDGLNFCTIKLHDIFGQKLELSDSSSAQTCMLESPHKINSSDMKKLNSQILCKNHEIKKLESEKHTLFTEVQRKDLLIANYSSKIKELEKALKYPRTAKKNLACMQDDTLTGTEEDEVFKACISELKDCLKEKELQLAEKLKQNECLQTELRLYKTQAAQKDKAIANMRALAFEVADKHDQVILLRDQVNSLEEELKKAHKKVQFKDNVIRELRREIKNATKQEDTARTSCICMSGRQLGSDTENKSFKSVTFNDLDCTQRSEYTMNTAMDSEMTQLGNSTRDEEDRCIKTLKEELEGLLEYQSCHCAVIEDQKRIMATQQTRLRDLIYKMLSDLSKNRSKLFFMRTRLLEIACGRDNTLHCSPKHKDSGYVSPEDVETECHILDTVRYKIDEIKAENDNLREQIRKSNTDMMSRNSSFDRCCQCGNTEKILQEVASVLSNLCGHKVPAEVVSEPIASNDGQMHPICQAMLTLENELNEKNKNLCDSQDLLLAKDCQLQRLQEELSRFEEECNNKNCQIAELQNAVDVHMNSIERLQRANDHLEAELAGVRRMTDSTEYKMLFEAKQKLEVESMRLEAMLLTLRDENLAIKELLVDTECDFRNLERKYLSVSKYAASDELKYDFQHLNERSHQLHQEIELRGGEQLYVNCVRHIRCKMEKECEKRLKDQEMKYREIIDDLTTELTALSKQVQVTQSELNRDELEHFDASFRELEQQNERLQQTIQDLEEKIRGYQKVLLKNQTEAQQLHSQNTITMNVLKDKDAKYRELTDQFQQLTRSLQALNNRCGCGAIRIIQSTISKAESLCSYLETQKDNTLSLFNEYTAAQISSTSLELNERVKELQAKINVLEKTLQQRDRELREANARLLQYAQQNGELNSELYMAQDQVFYLQAEEERLRSMVDRMSHEITELRAGRKERDNGLMAEMNRLRQTMDEHAKALNTANTTINMMERERRDLQHQTEMTNKENSALKVEVLALKEGTATHDGIEKSLRNQLVQTQSEVTLLKCDLERFLALRQDIENLKKNCNRLKSANYDLVRKYNDLVEDYNNLEDEYRKLVEIKDKLFTEVENSRIWQKRQKEQDQIIAKKFKKLEEHIDSLLEDRKNLIMKIGELHRDSILISGELGHVKDLCSGAFSKMNDRVRLSLDFGNTNEDVLIKRVQRIARKLSQTRSIWQNQLQISTD